MIRRLMFAIDVAVLTTVVYALTAADCWPPTAAAHLALVRAGVVTGTVGPYYPLWGWCVKWFGLNAGTISALVGGCATGLVMWNVSRITGVGGGIVSALLFAFSPPVWRAATRVDPSLFDLSLLLLALAFAGGRRWRLKAPAALLVAGTMCFDVAAVGLSHSRALVLGWTLPVAAVAVLAGVAFAFAIRIRCGWSRWGVIVAMALCLMVVPVLGVLAVSHPEGEVEDAAAGEMLAKVGPKTKWLVSDGMLEDAFARRLARQKDWSKPFLVCTARNLDESYVSNLVRKVSSVYPGDVQLRMAASLGVKAFLEDLPFADTNAHAVVFSWGRDLWTEEELVGVKERLERVMGDGRRPVCEYVRERLKRIEERRGAVSVPRSRGVAGTVDVGDLIERISEAAGARDVERMREQARELLQADRMNSLGNAILGTLAAQGGELDVAELHLRRAVAKGKAPPLVYNDLAETLRRRWKYQEAEEVARNALSLDPGNWRIMETLADILQSRDASHEDVEDVLREAERLAREIREENKTTLLYLRAVEYLRTGQKFRAGAIFRRLRSLPISADLRQRVDSFCAKAE